MKKRLHIWSSERFRSISIKVRIIILANRSDLCGNVQNLRSLFHIGFC